jgi:hypothetical protein
MRWSAAIPAVGRTPGGQVFLDGQPLLVVFQCLAHHGLVLRHRREIAQPKPDPHIGLRHLAAPLRVGGVLARKIQPHRQCLLLIVQSLLDAFDLGWTVETCGLQHVAQVQVAGRQILTAAGIGGVRRQQLLPDP